MAQVHPIPTLPAVHAQALSLLSDAQTPIPELGHVVETDPALTVSVLRAANSAASAPVTPIGTPGEAIVRVGIDITRKIVTAAVVNESFNRLDRAGIDTKELSRHLFTTALIADASAWGARPRSPLACSTSSAAWPWHRATPSATSASSRPHRPASRCSRSQRLRLRLTVVGRRGCPSLGRPG